MNSTPNFDESNRSIDDDDDDDDLRRMFTTEADAFLPAFARFRDVTDRLESILLWAGTVGNLLALITLCWSRHMRTVSFSYHKCLMAAHFAYCSNFLATKFVVERNRIWRDGIPTNSTAILFESPSMAYYVGVVSRVIASASGFVAMYSTLAISIDRFLALLFFGRYPTFNRASVAVAWIVCSIAFSLVSSWTPWVEKSVIGRRVVFVENRNESGSSSSMEGYKIVGRPISDGVRSAIHAKNVCNGLIRCGYLIALLALTSAVISRFVRQRQRRSSMIRENNQVRRKRDHSLYLLMVAMLVLAYVQVVPRELRRLLEAVYPEDYVEHRVRDRQAPSDDRRFYLRIYFYLYLLLVHVSNLCTIVERSLFFYLNLILNHNFRQEFMNLSRKLLRFPRVMGGDRWTRRGRAAAAARLEMVTGTTDRTVSTWFGASTQHRLSIQQSAIPSVAARRTLLTRDSSHSIL